MAFGGHRPAEYATLQRRQRSWELTVVTRLGIGGWTYQAIQLSTVLAMFDVMPDRRPVFVLPAVGDDNGDTTGLADGPSNLV